MDHQYAPLGQEDNHGSAEGAEKCGRSLRAHGATSRAAARGRSAAFWILVLFAWTAVIATALVMRSPGAPWIPPMRWLRGGDQGEASITCAPGSNHGTSGGGLCTTKQLSEKPVHIVVTAMYGGRINHCALAKRRLQRYARLHDYVLKWITEVHGLDPGGSSKMLKYREVLSMAPSASLVLLMDCDIVITNTSIRIQDVWAQHAGPDTGMLIARDGCMNFSVPINSGMMIVRPSEFVDDVFRYVVAPPKRGEEQLMRRYWPTSQCRRGRAGAVDHADGGYVEGVDANPLQDQPRLTHALVQAGELELGPLAPFETHKHVTVVSQRVMNSFFRNQLTYNDPSDSVWRPGDWVAHMTGMKLPERFHMTQQVLSMTDHADQPG